MIGSSFTLDVLKSKTEGIAERRRFFRKTGGFAVGMAGGAILAACGGNSDDANAQTMPNIDTDILNFALNLEYLEAQFYQYAATGAGLPANLLTGTGTQGAVVPGRKVTFTDPVVQAYALEIAADEKSHVAFLRTALSSAAIAQPAIDVGFSDPNGAFSTVARAAGLIGPAPAFFDPYANDANFLLAAYIFEDVGVTAYKGASPLITSKVFLEAAAGILAAEAYHAGLIRTVLYSKGLATPSLRTSTDQISTLRDTLDDGTTTHKDQGVSVDPLVPGASNIAPLDENGLAFSRSTGDVLNIVYGTASATNKGLFFPAGVNGNLVMSS